MRRGGEGGEEDEGGGVNGKMKVERMRRGGEKKEQIGSE